MPNQDLTTWTETDPDSDFTVTSSKLDITGLDRTEDAWVSKDWGDNYFYEDFRIHFTAYMNSSSDVGSAFTIFSLVDDLDNFGDLESNSKDALAVQFHRDGVITITELVAGVSNSAGANASLNTIYYLTLYRRLDQGTRARGRLYLEISTNSDRSSPVATITLDLLTYIRQFKYSLVGQGSGIYPDLSAWNKTDPNNRFTVLTDRVDISGQQRNEDVWLHREWGVDYWDGDFKIYLDAYMNSSSDTSSLIELTSLLNVLEDYEWLRNNSGDALGCRMRNNAGNLQISLNEVYGGTHTIQHYTGSFNTLYYLTLYRTGDTLYLDIDDSADRGSPLTTLSIGLNTPKLKLRYSMVAQSWNFGDTTAYTGYIENVVFDGGDAISAAQSTGYIENVDLEPNYKVVGTNSYAETLPYPFQEAIGFNGHVAYCLMNMSDGATAATLQIAYAPDYNKNSHPQHDIPYGYDIKKGYDFSICYGLYNYRLFYLITAEDSAMKIAATFKDNDSLQVSGKLFSFLRSVSTDTPEIPQICVDKGSYIHLFGMNETGGEVRHWISSSPLNVGDGFDAYNTLLNLGGGNKGGAQGLPYNASSNIGALYTEEISGTATLYFKYRNDGTWGSQETVDSNVHSFQSFRGIPFRNDKIWAIYRDDTDNKLYYRIRTALTGGSWGSDTLINDDTEYNGLDGFTSCADVGKDEVGYVIYWDGTNIVYRTWNGSSISSKTTLVSAPTLTSKRLSCAMFDSERIYVAYHADNQVKIEVIELTPTQVSDEGTIITTRGHADIGVTEKNIQSATVGDKTVFLWTEKDGHGYMRVRDTSANTWDASAMRFTSKSRWDVHNTFGGAEPGADGKLRVFEGGRDAWGSTEYLKISQSKYAVNHGSFGINKTVDYDDISPTEDSNATGRGYVSLILDNYDILHLITGILSPLRFIIREYRSGAWSTPVVFSQVGDSDNHLYHVLPVLGEESSGQKTICTGISFRDKSELPETQFGSVLQRLLGFVRLIPNGAGGYTAENANGDSITLPLTEENMDLVYFGQQSYLSNWAATTSYSVNDLRLFPGVAGHVARVKSISGSGTSGGSEPTLPTTKYQTVVDNAGANQITWENWGIFGDSLVNVFSKALVLNDNTPCIVCALRDTTDPYAINNIRLWKWNSGTTKWDFATVLNSNFTGHPQPIGVVGSEGMFITFPEVASGIEEIAIYLSEDDGDSFSRHSWITEGSNFDNKRPTLMVRSSILQTMMWNQRIHRTYGEVSFGFIQVSIATALQKVIAAYMRSN